MAHYPRLPVGLVRFATTERTELNTAVRFAFGAANERLETSLTLGEVACADLHVQIVQTDGQHLAAGTEQAQIEIKSGSRKC